MASVGPEHTKKNCKRNPSADKPRFLQRRTPTHAPVPGLFVPVAHQPTDPEPNKRKRNITAPGGKSKVRPWPSPTGARQGPSACLGHGSPHILGWRGSRPSPQRRAPAQPAACVRQDKTRYSPSTKNPLANKHTAGEKFKPCFYGGWQAPLALPNRHWLQNLRHQPLCFSTD
jgi:hypothetical protein